MSGTTVNIVPKVDHEVVVGCCIFFLAFVVCVIFPSEFVSPAAGFN